MSPERWQQIQQVFEEVRECDSGARSSSLERLCKGDDDLRGEIEWMLAHQSDARSLMKNDAFEMAAKSVVAGGASSDRDAEPILSFPLGTKLGAYEIKKLLGKGGMGEVYQARDSKLKRDVAVKILPNEFNREPGRLSRFQREAEALASLNHSNIAAIYDLQESNGFRFLVMELVDGETLARRIARGALPTAEALNIGRQICEALEAAHEKGIVHRDLKPGNIKIRTDGTVKVLDFGLAKVVSRTDFDDSGTRRRAATEEGIILGTARYMSPEQARGLPVDKRADIWSFGVVLYELLTGKQMFTDESTADILAAVVRAEPDWSALPASTPPSIRRLLQRCVEKDLKKRLPDIGVARLEIDEAFAAPVALVADVPAPVATQRNIVPWLVSAIALLALVFVSWFGVRTPPEVRWTGTRLSEVAMFAHGVRVSPDGQFLAFAAWVDGQLQLAVMKPETGNWTILTHDKSRGFVFGIGWSRDGEKLYFDRKDSRSLQIFSVPVLGGDEQLVLDKAACPEVLPDGSLLFLRPNAERRFQLYRFWPESGRVQSLKALPTGGGNSPTPFRATPNGKHVIFFGKPFDDPAGKDHLYALNLDLDSEKVTRLAPDVSFAVGAYFPLAATPDGESALFELPVGDMHRIVSVPLDGSNELHTMLTLDRNFGTLDAGGDGSLYLSREERSTEAWRVSPEGGAPERIGTMFDNGSISQVLPLPDGRLLMNSQIGGRDHLLLLKSQGSDPSRFLDTQEETAAPMAVVGREQVAFMIGFGKNRTIGLASLSDRQITGRLEGARGTAINTMVASTEGKTIYYSASGSIWSIPVTDGRPERLRDGQSVTLDPNGRQLIVTSTGVLTPGKHRLVRVPIAGGSDRPVILEGEGDVKVAPDDLWPNAVDKTGRIAAQLMLPNSPIFPLGVIDPNTGHVQIIRIGYDAQLSGGWDAGGKLLIKAVTYRSSLWRFRPDR